jgi:hypothetical protein
VEIDSSTSKQLAEQVFSNDGNSNSAINGIYFNVKSLASHITLYNSLASDDVKNFSSSTAFDEYRLNDLKSTSTLPWTALYSVIYACNSALEGLAASKGVSEKARQYYTGEAKFNRAFCYFYLVNLFGRVPLILSTDVSMSATASRDDTAKVYNQIINDLKDAQASTSPDYTYTGGDKSRANRWAATALLARTYLYLRDYVHAEEQANAIINSSLYSLLNGPTGVFVKNNSEAILQLANNSSEGNGVASNFIFVTSPNVICTDFLLNAFESGDLRRSSWIGAKVYSGKTYNYPFKFTTTAVNPNEWYTILRLSEMYLVRAEARAMQNDFKGAIDDVNLVRLRHGGLSIPLPIPISQSGSLDIILRERQVDFFTEGMHRFFDLKRTGRLDAVMLSEKQLTWKSRSAFYPLPLSDIQRNTNLEQNPLYQ